LISFNFIFVLDVTTYRPVVNKSAEFSIIVLGERKRTQSTNYVSVSVRVVALCVGRTVPPTLFTTTRGSRSKSLTLTTRYRSSSDNQYSRVGYTHSSFTTQLH